MAPNGKGDILRWLLNNKGDGVLAICGHSTGQMCHVKLWELILEVLEHEQKMETLSEKWGKSGITKRVEGRLTERIRLERTKSQID